ncbi:hypothetical protein N752_05870 [Desulforamulus aquiferis]|nr:hypothetical protein N752_05870 [Desulforamulus aquiferis]
MTFYLVSARNDDPCFGLLATGVAGTSLRQINRTLFLERLEQAADRKVYLDLINRWFRSFFEQEEIELITSDSADLSLTLDKFHNLALGRIKERYLNNKQVEEIRLRKKRIYNEKCIEKAIYKMSSVTQKEQHEDTVELLSDMLLSACKLVGQAMKIEIISPPSANQEGPSKDPWGILPEHQWFGQGELS